MNESNHTHNKQDSSTPNSTPKEKMILNYSVALVEFLNEKKLLHMTIEKFISIQEKKMPDLQAAVEKKDFVWLGHEMHRIKGGALNLRAEIIAEIAVALEEEGREERPTWDEDKIKTLFSHFCQAMTDFKLHWEKFSKTL